MKHKLCETKVLSMRMNQRNKDLDPYMRQDQKWQAVRLKGELLSGR